MVRSSRWGFLCWVFDGRTVARRPRPGKGESGFHGVIFPPAFLPQSCPLCPVCLFSPPAIHSLDRGRAARAPSAFPDSSRFPSASFSLCPLCALWLEFRPRKFFPIVGKLPKNFSNHWKKWAVFSNHWKTFFQSLENRRFPGGLADCAGGRGLIPCLAGGAAPCRSGGGQP